MELKRLRMEREAEEEKERIKKESAAAIEKYKIEEAEKAEKAKKEKEEREKEYQTRIRDDLRKSGMNIQPIPPTTYYSCRSDPNSGSSRHVRETNRRYFEKG
jgi:hypothetical protein